MHLIHEYLKYHCLLLFVRMPNFDNHYQIKNTIKIKIHE